MDNVATFKTSRDKSKALVVVENMDPKEALKMHTSVKSQGKGAIREFIATETPYPNYGGYYYQMKKLGVMPMKPRGPKVPESHKQKSLEDRIKYLESKLESLSESAGKRAAKIVHQAYDDLDKKSLSFLSSMIARDLPSCSLSWKQEKWLSDLEKRFGV